MKKHLIAAAVAAALAVPAMAQVSIGGNIDRSYNFGSGNTDAILSDLFSSNTLLLSGTEDMGGGLKAFFNIDSSTAAVFDTDAGSVITFGGRGARLGLSGGFGSVAFGKTPNTAINLLRGGVAGNRSLMNDGGFTDDGDRPNNTVDFTSPAFNGVTARAILQLTSKDYELSAAYSRGPLSAGLAYAEHVAGNNTGARVTYNFGIASGNFSYQKIGTSSASNTGSALTAVGAGATARATGTYMSVGVSVPLGATTVFAEWQDRADVQNRINVGAVQALSKRTSVYALFSDNSGATGATAIAAGVNDAVTAVGIRHSF